MSMCDYSLDFVASWPATVGDKLVTTKFKNSVNRGFARAQVQSDWPFECFNDCISSRSRPNWPLVGRSASGQKLPKWNRAAPLTFERKPQINRLRITAR
jgi:hypothetical protein